MEHPPLLTLSTRPRGATAQAGNLTRSLLSLQLRDSAGLDRSFPFTVGSFRAAHDLCWSTVTTLYYNVGGGCCQKIAWRTNWKRYNRPVFRLTAISEVVHVAQSR
jgi:hypothetical protein